MNGKLRVLHIVPYFPPDRIGGVGEVAAHLHQGLLARGHESQVITGGTGRDEHRIRRIARSPIGFILKCGLQTDLLRNCDVIHCHQGEAIGALLAKRVLRLKVSAVTTFHCTCSGIGRAHRPYTIEGQGFGRDFKARLQRGVIAPVRHLLDRWALGLSDRANFISRHGAIDFVGLSAGPAADVVYYGLPERAPSESSTSTPIEPIELLYAGTSGHRKRVYALPFVLARVRERMPNVRLRIVGFGVEGDRRFERLLEAQNVRDAVCFEGPKRSDELAPYYRAARVLLVPSAHEGLPMVIIEAMQCGTPCVATNVSGHPEIIENGVNGFLVDVDRPDQMAERVLQILADPAKHRAMSAAAERVVAERFGLDRQVEEYLAIYRALCGRTTSTGD